MNGVSMQNPNMFIEGDAAALTDAAYRVLLRRGLGHQWLEIQLELWRAMTDQVQRMERLKVESGSRPKAFPKLEWLPRGPR
jgi:hypothetical protein